MSDDVNKKPDEDEDNDFDDLPPYIQLLAIITDVVDDYMEIMAPHEIMGILDIVKHKVLRASICESMDEYDEMEDNEDEEGENNDGSSESGDDFSTID